MLRSAGTPAGCSSGLTVQHRATPSESEDLPGAEHSQASNASRAVRRWEDALLERLCSTTSRHFFALMPDHAAMSALLKSQHRRRLSGAAVSALLKSQHRRRLSGAPAATHARCSNAMAQGRRAIRLHQCSARSAKVLWAASPLLRSDAHLASHPGGKRPVHR
eukprot:5178878-Prymnesium_polylepis.2